MLNPMIKAYDFRWKLMFAKPLNEVEGMAYGVREDISSGLYKTNGVAINWCPDSNEVCYWVVA
jgi:hypothetical protein